MKYNPFLYNLPLVFGIMFLIVSWEFMSLGYNQWAGVTGIIGLILLGVYDQVLQIRFAKPKQEVKK